MADEILTHDFPDTPAGRAARWFLHQISTRGDGLTVDEIADHMRFEPPWVPEHSLERFQGAQPDPTRKVVETKSPSPFEFELWVVDGAGRRWHDIYRVEESPPHRLTYTEMRADLGPGVVIREATPDDTAKLAEIERAAPIVLGDVSVTYDRGDDFLAFTRLMEENVTYVIDKEGEILGTYACASHIVRSAGTEHRAMLFHHLRIPANQEKRGFFSALNMKMFDHYAERYGEWWRDRRWAPYGYIALANTAALRLGAPGSWSFGPLRAVLDCRTLAGAPHGRPAGESDAAEIADVINRCHDREAMFRPYTVGTLTARMHRAPDLYSWQNVLVGDGAVLGVWPSGLRVTTQGDGERREAVRASVIDHGYVPGADDEFERLIRSWCAKLVELGSTELSVLTSEGSPTYPLLKRLAFEMDAFDFRMEIAEPEDAKEKGLYVDPVYF